MARRTAPEDDLTRFLLATGLSSFDGFWGEAGASLLVSVLVYGVRGWALDVAGGDENRGVGSTTEHCSKVGEEFGSGAAGNWAPVAK
jgi:hypothetical protein